MKLRTTLRSPIIPTRKKLENEYKDKYKDSSLEDVKELKQKSSKINTDENEIQMETMCNENEAVKKESVTRDRKTITQTFSRGRNPVLMKRDNTKRRLKLDDII